MQRPTAGHDHEPLSHMLTYPIYKHLEHLEHVARQVAQMLRFDTMDRVPEHLEKRPPFRVNPTQVLKMPQMFM